MPATHSLPRFKDSWLNQQLARAVEDAEATLQDDYLRALANLDEVGDPKDRDYLFLTRQERARRIAEAQRRARARIRNCLRAIRRGCATAPMLTRAAAAQATTLYRGRREWRGRRVAIVSFVADRQWTNAKIVRRPWRKEQSRWRVIREGYYSPPVLSCVIRCYDERGRQASAVGIPAGQVVLIEATWRAALAWEKQGRA